MAIHVCSNTSVARFQPRFLALAGDHSAQDAELERAGRVPSMYQACERRIDDPTPTNPISNVDTRDHGRLAAVRMIGNVPDLGRHLREHRDGYHSQTPN